jgi:hypothetical protein
MTSIPTEPRSSRFANPFYFLLLVVGGIFCVTASAYGMMAIRGSRGEELPTSEAGKKLLEWLDQSGPTAILIQLSFLAVLTFAAIYSDDYWMARWQKKFPGEKHT